MQHCLTLDACPVPSFISPNLTVVFECNHLFGAAVWMCLQIQKVNKNIRLDGLLLESISLITPFIVSMLCLFISAGTATAETPGEWVGQVSVIDADTIDIGDVRFRLHGIDAPESAQLCRHPARGDWRCGQKAALALADKIRRSHVTCRQKDKDRYGRIVAVCSLKGEDLNRWLVRSGWAVAYVKYSRDYVGDEGHAIRTGQGIWSGAFVPPSEWRRGVRLDGVPEESDTAGCRIKGNISRGGKRIYHLPGMHWYERTRINEAKGERWFCSETEARAAGWRKSGS